VWNALIPPPHQLRAHDYISLNSPQRASTLNANQPAQEEYDYGCSCLIFCCIPRRSRPVFSEVQLSASSSQFPVSEGYSQKECSQTIDPKTHHMATRSQGPCVNLPDDEYLDDSDADVFHHRKTNDAVEASVKNISSIPPRRHATFVPVMPPENTESRLQPRSPPPSPTPIHIAQKDIKPLTSQKLSNQYSKESIANISSSLAPSPLPSWPLRVSQEDTKPLTSRKSSKQSSEEPATSIPLLSPTSTPPASHIAPEDTKPLTSSKQSGKDSIASSALPLTTVLPTPDKTPPDRSRREKTKAKVKSEPSPSPEIPEM